MKRTPKALKFRTELLADVAAARSTFLSDGFRELTPKTLTEAEWNFSALAQENEATVRRALAYELARECEAAQEMCADLAEASRIKSPKATAAFRKKWPLGRRPVFPMALYGIFPLPFLTILAMEGGRCSSESGPIIAEMDEGAFANHLKFPMRSQTYHRLEIEWGAGRPRAKRELLKWFAAISAPEVAQKTQRRRGSRLLIEDALAQLSAWRARRAGLTHDDYNALLQAAGIRTTSKLGFRGFVRPYAEATPFRNAAVRAEERIKKVRKSGVSIL